MIGFIIGAILGSIVTTIVLCCCVAAGNADRQMEEENELQRK